MSGGKRWWWLTWGALALYVALRMGVFNLWAAVATPAGTIWLPDTFATVDHPFHVARADMLWQALSQGHLLRWVGQHQGGYPVEFYPLGEAWLEVSLRILSLGWLPAAGAHSLVTIALFLLPGVSFAALARLDGLTPAVALLAMALHVALPGGWYDGGYTELVQWGLITNVAATYAAFLVLPLLIRFLATGEGWAGALSAALAAFAIYCNPRSLVALVAVGAGVWLTALLTRQETLKTCSLRLGLVAVAGGLLAAPELGALARFDDLYRFVHYSGYESLEGYVATAVAAVTLPVALLAVVGIMIGLLSVRRTTTRSVTVVTILYVLLTLAVAFVPAVERVASQLEPTRLMPLQRLLTLYLAAVAIWCVLSWLGGRDMRPNSTVTARGNPTASPQRPVGASESARRRLAEALIVAIAVIILAVQTRPLPGPPPNPASPEIVPVGLYPIEMSAQPAQADLEAAVRAADAAAAPGTAMLILGSALSWHQQLWAPLWTSRLLYYDNWLWYWHPYHAGTPGYSFSAGHHYPDPERTLDRDYLARHGIGAVLVSRPTRAFAATSPLLSPVQQGIYDVYVVIDPTTTVTFGDANVKTSTVTNQRIEASASSAGAPTVRVNWFPRWQGTADGKPVSLSRRDDGYIAVDVTAPTEHLDLEYAVQPADWFARVLAVAGALLCGWLCLQSMRKGRQQFRFILS